MARALGCEKQREPITSTNDKTKKSHRRNPTAPTLHTHFHEKNQRTNQKQKPEGRIATLHEKPAGHHTRNSSANGGHPRGKPAGACVVMMRWREEKSTEGGKERAPNTHTHSLSHAHSRSGVM